MKLRQASLPGEGVTGWHSRRRFRKVLIKRERERKSNDGRNVKERKVKEREREREKSEREREAPAQATRGSNLPGRRDFASEANC